MSKIKAFWSLFFLFFLSYSFSQKIYFEKVELGNPKLKHNLETLSNKLLKIYKEEDSQKYLDNYFRLQMVSGDYDGALITINKIRDSYKESYPLYSKVIGVQFELYLLAQKQAKFRNFNGVYSDLFKEKYEKLSVQTKQLLPESFEFKKDYNKNEIIKILHDSISEDSISVENAVLLCRHYNTYKAIETFLIAKSLMKQFDEEEFLVKDKIIIKTKNNKEISLYYVLDKKIPGKKPTILNFTTYMRIDDNHISQSKINAAKGYNIVNAYSRGVYLSKDALTPFEFEREDVNEVIDWIVKQPWSNGKVGMIGGSYDGFSQWAAVKDIHPALKTIIPSASVGFGIDFPMYNNCFSLYMLRWLSYVKKETDYEIFNDEKKWLSVYNAYYTTGVAFNKLDSLYGKTNPIFQKWLKHPSFDNFYRSTMPSGKEFSKINIPVLTITGYYDADQRGAMYYYEEHHKYNKNANHYLVVGPYGHAGVISGVENEYKGYKIDSVARIDTEDISYQWFDYILKGKDRPEFLKDKVNYQPMGSNQWKSASDIAHISNKKLKLFLDGRKLQKSKPDLNYISQKIDFLDRKDTLKSFDKERVFDNLIQLDNLNNSILFESDVINTPFEINGSFGGNLKVSINKKDMDITINFYEKLSSGKYLKLSHEYFGRASYSKNNAKRNLLQPHKIENIPIQNTFFTSRQVEKGSKLIIVLGIRKSPDVQINYGTGKDVSLETIADAKEPLEIKWYNDSYIEIPVKE